MILEYPYPVVTYYGDDPDDCEVDQYQGSITTIRLKEEPYEAEVNAMGYSFHILFGYHRDGWFLCIPNWNFGCELAHPSDLFWNMDSMTRETSMLDYEDATAIAYALNTLSSYLEK